MPFPIQERGKESKTERRARNWRKIKFKCEFRLVFNLKLTGPRRWEVLDEAEYNIPLIYIV